MGSSPSTTTHATNDVEKSIQTKADALVKKLIEKMIEDSKSTSPFSPVGIDMDTRLLLKYMMVSFLKNNLTPRYVCLHEGDSLEEFKANPWLFVDRHKSCSTVECHDCKSIHLIVRSDTTIGFSTDQMVELEEGAKSVRAKETQVLVQEPSAPKED